MSMSETEPAASIARPDAATCICGTYHYGEYGQGWLRDWCANQCCWTEETCRSCGARYAARTGERHV
jgi:hypothetical protein